MAKKNKTTLKDMIDYQRLAMFALAIFFMVGVLTVSFSIVNAMSLTGL